MKNFTFKALALCLSGVVLLSCEQAEESEVNPISVTQSKNFGTDPTSCEIIEFDAATPVTYDKGAAATVYSENTPVRIMGQYRKNKGDYHKQNRALMFNTTNPDANNAAFKTPSPAAIRPMGDVLTLGKAKGDVNELYTKGGRIELDFSAMGSIELKGIHVLDITADEADSKIELIGKKNKVIKTMALPVTGAYGATRLRIDTPGVVKLRVVFGPNSTRTGGGAIDVIEFCRE
ncbi:hypothetical protein [Pontibacter rugosus]|uniref:Uncharacterized protein n=1 Tax=Pontibacter rugosus TaxID=1745966 RepID=A0ABW3SNA8_9BACT